MTGREDELVARTVQALHAAVYGYGVLGARLDVALRRQALAADDGLRERRDALVARLRARGVPVPPAQAVYDVAVAGRADALALAVRLEEGVAVRWRDLVGGTDDRDLRTLAVAALGESAVRAARWRAAAGVRPVTVALPGSA